MNMIRSKISKCFATLGALVLAGCTTINNPESSYVGGGPRGIVGGGLSKRINKPYNRSRKTFVRESDKPDLAYLLPDTDTAPKPKKSNSEPDYLIFDDISEKPSKDPKSPKESSYKGIEDILHPEFLKEISEKPSKDPTTPQVPESYTQDSELRKSDEEPNNLISTNQSENLSEDPKTTQESSFKETSEKKRHAEIESYINDRLESYDQHLKELPKRNPKDRKLDYIWYWGENNELSDIGEEDCEKLFQFVKEGKYFKHIIRKSCIGEENVANEAAFLSYLSDWWEGYQKWKVTDHNYLFIISVDEDQLVKDKEYFSKESSGIKIEEANRIANKTEFVNYLLDEWKIDRSELVNIPFLGQVISPSETDSRKEYVAFRKVSDGYQRWRVNEDGSSLSIVRVENDVVKYALDLMEGKR
jgi:hypothetical protein